MLATANRSRVSNRVTIIYLSRAGGVVDPVKNFLSSSSITVQNLVAVCHYLWARGSQKLGTLGSRPLGRRSADQNYIYRNTSLTHVRYRAGFGCSRCKVTTYVESKSSGFVFSTLSGHDYSFYFRALPQFGVFRPKIAIFFQFA